MTFGVISHVGLRLSFWANVPGSLAVSTNMENVEECRICYNITATQINLHFSTLHICPNDATLQHCLKGKPKNEEAEHSVNTLNVKQYNISQRFPKTA